MTENYIDVTYEYYSAPDDDGMRLKSEDVWYATKPTPPSYALVDLKDRPVPGYEAQVKAGWSIHKAGLTTLFIFDRDDINGLRALLDKLEHDFDRRDMEDLQKQFKVDNDEEDE